MEILIIIILMEASSFPHPAKTTFKLQLKKDGPIITLNSNFDSGNMALAEVGLNGSILITPANDCAATQTPSHSKGWFYFSVAGVPLHTKTKFAVKKMQQLSAQMKFSEYFKPVFKAGEENWERVEQALVFTKEDDTQLHFEVPFHKNTEYFFAYTFPFSFQQCEHSIKNAQRQAKLLKSVYFKDEIMIKTAENRPVHLVTISSIDDKEETREQKMDSCLFNWGDRPFQFKGSKKVVIVSARVHPGQAPSSHTFNGLLKFLLSNDARAHFLRKNFVFKLVPMLNPDGVADGHYRMDILGQNLNRFYNNPDVFKQPAVYAMRKLGEHYQKCNRLCFYIDLHAHPQRKGNFIYGNAMDTTEQQVQTQLFPRLLALNCPQFDYTGSSFSKYHMNAKDKNEDLTKQGCGRVVFNTHFQVVNAYTMQCGYTCSNYINEICTIQNAHRKFEKCPILFDQLENLKSAYYCNKKTLYFTIKSYENLGKNILVSLLDLFELNPASRIPHTHLKSLANIKEEISNQLTKGTPFNRDKITRSQANKPLRVMPERPRGWVRAPSIDSSKENALNKLRNRTVAKINIGLF